MRVPLSIVMQPPLPPTPPPQRDHWLSDWRGPRFLDRRKKICSRKRVHPSILPFMPLPPSIHTLPFFFLFPPSTIFHSTLILSNPPHASFLSSLPHLHILLLHLLIPQPCPSFLSFPLAPTFIFFYLLPPHLSFPSPTTVHFFF